MKVKWNDFDYGNSINVSFSEFDFQAPKIISVFAFGNRVNIKSKWIDHSIIYNDMSKEEFIQLVEELNDFVRIIKRSGEGTDEK